VVCLALHLKGVVIGREKGVAVGSDLTANPFQALEVSVPDEFHTEMVRYSQREGKANIDESPFGRMVDMWFFAICVAARAGLKPVDSSSRKSVKVIEGQIFSTDPWRIQMLMLVAIQYAGNVDVVADPKQMMNIANGLAVAGFPKVLEMIKDGDGEAIWNLSEAAESLIKAKPTAA
jgi:hypothetical protein